MCYSLFDNPFRGGNSRESSVSVRCGGSAGSSLSYHLCLAQFSSIVVPQLTSSCQTIWLRCVLSNAVRLSGSHPCPVESIHSFFLTYYRHTRPSSVFCIISPQFCGSFVRLISVFLRRIQHFSIFKCANHPACFRY